MNHDLEKKNENLLSAIFPAVFVEQSSFEY